MNLNLKNKNVLVCGASQGIGKAAAIELAALGANVTLLSRSPEKMGVVLAEMLPHQDGQDHDFLVADMQDHADLKKKMLRLVVEKNIHILINNTGGPAPGKAIDADPEAFLKAFMLHLMSFQIVTQAVVKGMIEDGYGRIINVISTSVKQPIDGLGVSNTIRGAVANWAKTLSNELGKHQITVNNVLPGATNTSRLKQIIEKRAERDNVSYEDAEAKFKQPIPLGRFADPSELGSVIAFIASPAAGYINGTNIVVDGGRTKSL